MADRDKEITRFMLLEKLISQIGVIARWGFGAWATVQIVRELAGKETYAQILLSYFGDNTPPNAKTSLMLWILAIACGVWAYFERRLRHQKTRQLQSRIKKLEERLDPDRTTSGLSPTGETRPGDRP